ncbi:hypothetical protein Tco_0056575, partial [Tanacetum coccineum]
GLEGEGHSLDDEGPGSEDEGPGLDTTVDEPLGLGYEALRRHELALGECSVPVRLRVYTDILNYVPSAAPIQTPLSPEWSSGSLPVSPSSLSVLSPIASPVTTPAATISIDAD